MPKLYSLILALFLFQTAFSQVTVHVLNPWRNNTCDWHRDSLRMSGNNIVGYYPGSGMAPEGGSWFYYVYPQSNVNFMLVNWCGPDVWQERVEYRFTFNLDSILNTFSVRPNEIWVTIPDTTGPPIITDRPPLGCKWIYFLNPWPIGAPLVMIEGFGSPKMRMDTSITRCGWFKFPFYGDPATARVKFMNSLDSTIFSSIGIGDGDFISLSATFAASDTAWVLAIPYPTGVAAVYPAYPGKSAVCEKTLLLATTLRDWDTTHPDFGVGESKQGCGADKSYNAITPGIAQRQLDANGKPQLGTSTCPVDRFNWFTTETVSGQYINAICHNLKLTKNEDGLFEYDTAYFYPADTFRYLDSNRTVPNPRYGGGQDNNGFPHNYYFTMELAAQFEYRKGQTFYFRGDDDVWVFINNRLVVDIGGIHNPCEGLVKLDTMGLTVGNTYSFKLFFCERNCCGSNFRMVTSLNLKTTSSLFTIVTNIPPNIQRFDMKEKISKNNLSCDPGETVIDTQPAIMDFFIEGPPFPANPPTRLTAGTSYGGITIIGDTTVILDTTAITGLPPGDYLIRYFLRSDHSQGGTIPFTISALPPDHVDLLTDDVILDPAADAQVDSIVIGMIETNVEAYAVVRDAEQNYLNHAPDPDWTVRDPNVATVARHATDASRCILTKVNAGTTWLVVNQSGLKPDSTLVITYVLPQHPVIVSGVMLDENADLVPELLRLGLSDTFKTDQRLDSVVVAYKGLLITVPASLVTMQGTQLDVPVPASVGIDGRPTGTATIHMTVGTDAKSHSRAFTDGVCPAVIKADVLENDGSNPDVLFLTFSEPLTVASIVGRQLQLLKQGTADTLALIITLILGQTNDSTFTVQIAASDPKAIPGDSLRLIPGSVGGTLTDKEGNKAHLLNRPVVIGFRPGAASIAAAWYHDTDADGILDSVVVCFKRKVEPAEIDTARINRDSRQFRMPFSVSTRLGDSTYRIPIGDATNRLTTISTRGAMDLTVTYHDFPDVQRNAIVVDRAAPVIKSAQLIPGPLTATNTRGTDTLIVTFSEAVDEIQHMNPFFLSSKEGGHRYSFTLLYEGPDPKKEIYSYRFVVQSIDNPQVPFASAGDTIWINSTAGVSDSLGVAQTNPNNRRVLLQVEWPKAVWRISITNNPFIPNVTSIPKQYGGGYGTAVIARPTTPVDEEKTFLRMTIYDAVGNILLSSDFIKGAGVYYFKWNGHNKANRLVGAGTYLALIKINEGPGRVSTETVRLGVKRKK
ncbi:MAG: fibro-slime domain-containing protein [Chitinispirillaceae bacterium]|nr:fibro-slime domain-containing protein [Chitinispirillaceae bacterium]